MTLQGVHTPSVPEGCILWKETHTKGIPGGLPALDVTCIGEGEGYEEEEAPGTMN